MFNTHGFALENNKHVLLEKPGGLKANELQELGDMADSKGLVLLVAYHWRFFPAATQGLAEALSPCGHCGKPSCRFSHA